MQNEIEINQPVETVFSYIVESKNTSNYLSKEFQIKPVSTSPSHDGRFSPGSVVVGQGNFAGTRVRIEYQVVVFEPGRLIKLKAVGGQYESEVYWRLFPLDTSNCRISLEVNIKPRYDLGGFIGRMINLVVAPIINIILNQSMIRLKNIMEFQAAEALAA